MRAKHGAGPVARSHCALLQDLLIRTVQNVTLAFPGSTIPAAERATASDAWTIIRRRQPLPFRFLATSTLMGYQIATLALAPWLIAQGRRARARTIRLPEPPGPRAGTSGSGTPLRLLITGDSAAAGVGARTQEEALSGQLVANLSSDFAVSWKLMGKTGRTSQDLIDHLAAVAPERFDVALISIGVNDITTRTPARAWVGQQLALANILKSRFGVRHVLFTNPPPMHLFPALPQPLRWFLGARAKQFGAILPRVVAIDPACELIRLEFQLDSTHIADDGFHPAAPTYRLWALAAAESIRRRIDDTLLAR